MSARNMGISSSTRPVRRTAHSGQGWSTYPRPVDPVKSPIGSGNQMQATGMIS